VSLAAGRGAKKKKKKKKKKMRLRDKASAPTPLRTLNVLVLPYYACNMKECNLQRPLLPTGYTSLGLYTQSAVSWRLLQVLFLRWTGLQTLMVTVSLHEREDRV
jgi:hypothetical protein